MSDLREYQMAITEWEVTEARPSTDDVLAAAEAIAGQALAELEDPAGDICPFMVMATEKALTVAWMPHFPEDSGGMVANALPGLLSQQDASSFALVATVWVAPLKSMKGRRPSESPQRKESIQILLADREGRQESHMAQLKRRKRSPATLDSFSILAQELPSGLAPLLAALSIPFVTDDEELIRWFDGFKSNAMVELQRSLDRRGPHPPPVLLLGTFEDESPTAHIVDSEGGARIADMMAPFADHLPQACAFAAALPEANEGLLHALVMGPGNLRECLAIETVRGRTGLLIDTWGPVSESPLLDFYAGYFGMGLSLAESARERGEKLDAKRWFDLIQPMLTRGSGQIAI